MDALRDHQYYCALQKEVKEEVVDCGFVEVDSEDVHQLCTACLCATRTTHTLDDVSLKQYYMNILTETQLDAGAPVLQSPRLCWECVAHLKRSVRFREQVQDSYRLLQPMLLMCDKEGLSEFLKTSVCRPGRLRRCFSHCIDISPQCDDHQPMSAEQRDNKDDGAEQLQVLVEEEKDDDLRQETKAHPRTQDFFNKSSSETESETELTPGPSNSRIQPPNTRKQDASPMTVLSSPVAKRRRKGDMGSNDKMRLIRIYEEVEKSCLSYPFKSEIMRKTAEMVGVSARTVSRILREYRTTGRVKSPDRSTPKLVIVDKLDESTLSAIRAKCNQLHSIDELPTVDKLLKIINDDENLPSFKRSTFYRILHKLNIRLARSGKS